MIRQHLSKIELVDSLDGALTDARARWAEVHLGQCKTCATALSEMRSVAEAVRSLEEAAAPEGLRQRVLGAAEVREGLRSTCRQTAPLLHQYLDEQLAPVPMAALDLHLRACARCRTEMAALRAARRLVQSLPPVTPPGRVREAVYAARRAAPSRWLWGARLRPALAAAGVAAALGVLLLLRGPSPEVAHQRGPTAIAQRPPSPAEVPAAPLSSRTLPTSDSEAAALAAETEAAQATVEGQGEPVDEPRAPAHPRMVARVPKGPSPAPTSDEMGSAGITAPSALRTLRAVAGGAAHDREVQLAMDLAGERFATLRSEAMLHLPQEVGSPAPTEGAPSESSPAVSPNLLGAPEEISGGAPKPDSGRMATANFAASRAV